MTRKEAPPAAAAGPSAEEIAARNAAEQDKISGIQERVRRDTDRMMRLFGARSAMSGSSSPLMKL